MRVPSDLSVACRDRAVPGLGTVLDATAAAALVARLLPDAPQGTPQVTYTRYKPGASCLVALRYDSDALPVYVTLKALGDAATAKWAKYRGDARVAVDEALRIAIRRFPADGELRGPRWLFDDGRRDEVLTSLGLHSASRFQLIAYKPERRVVVGATVHGSHAAVLKCYDADGFSRALQAHRALARLPHLPVSPATAWNTKRGVIVSPWIAGRVIDVARDPLERFIEAGTVLAAVHDAPMDVRAGEHDADVHAGLHRIVQDVTGWSPATREPLVRIVNRLARHRAEPAPLPTAIHGDFYTKQLVCDDDAVSLLDFDECAIADPHIDLATFAAHLERDVLRRAYSRERADAVMAALLTGYKRTRPIDARRLTWRTAEAIVRLTPHPFRHRDPAWPALTERLVLRAQSLLDGIPLVVPPRPAACVTPAATRDARAWSRLATDPALAFAACLASRERMSGALAQRADGSGPAPGPVTGTTVLRHKPGRRCVIAIDVAAAHGSERWFGKVRARGVDRRAAHLHHALWHTEANAVLAEPLGTVDSMHMTLQRAVDGVTLDAALAAGHDPREVGRLVAHTMTSLHTIALDTGRTWTLDDERSVLRTRLTALATTHRTLAPTVSALVDALLVLAEPLATRPTASVIHRDLYHDQVLVHGDRATLIDLDLVTQGDPALDAGNLVGHLVDLQWRRRIDARAMRACCEAFCEAVVERSEGSITEDVIVRYALLSLGRLAEIASRHRERMAYLPLHLATLHERLARAEAQRTLSVLLEVPSWHTV